MRPADLAKILEPFSTPFQPRGMFQSLGNAGGLSGSAFWRYRSAAGELVLRAWPSGFEAARLSMVHTWTAEIAARSGLPIPAPILDRLGRTAHRHDGRLWELCPWIPGSPDSDNPPSPVHVRAAFAALGRVHASLEGRRQDANRSPALMERVVEIEQLERSDLSSLAASLESSRSDPIAGPGRRWLVLAGALIPKILPTLRAAAEMRVPLQPCLRDVRGDHFLFEGDCLSGLIDFGAMGIECPSADIARLCADWLGGRSGLRDEALAAHAAGRGRPLDEVEARLISAYEMSADFLIAGHWLRWHFLEGRRFDRPDAVATGVARGLQRIDRLAERLVVSPGIGVRPI